jgi:hypothetical protein
VLGEVLQRFLDLEQRVRFDQFTKLVLAEKFTQQFPVQRERSRLALRVRCIALVHVGGDVIEEQ